MDQPKQVSLAIDGMHCDACVRRVRKAIEKVPGVEIRDVRIGAADLSGEESALKDARQAVEKAGYTPR